LIVLRRAITGLVCAFAAAACAAGDPAEVAVELGEGQDGWRQLEDGATVELHLGPQGGQHMVAGARISGLWPGERRDGTDDPRVGFRVVDAGGEVWSAALRPVRRPFVPCAAGGFELDGGSTVYMIDGASELDGREVELGVDVEDAFGAAASDARLVVVRVVIDE
jgi:hypothetical protein